MSDSQMSDECILVVERAYPRAQLERHLRSTAESANAANRMLRCDQRVAAGMIHSALSEMAKSAMSALAALAGTSLAWRAYDESNAKFTGLLVFACAFVVVAGCLANAHDQLRWALKYLEGGAHE